MVYPGQKRTIFVNVAGGGMEKRTAAHSAKPAGAELVGEPIDVRAVGDGRRLVVEHVKADYEIAPGDVLASSDRGQLLPLGLTVGKVATVERDKNDAHFVNITVEPIADLTTLQDVLVVIPYKKG
jgi:cell shape-determining protein MreC